MTHALSTKGRNALSMTRRKMLAALAAASTAAVPNSSIAAPTENPELLRLAEALPDVKAEYDAAYAESWRIRREAAKVWPPMPAEIISFNGGGCEYERDIAGTGIERVLEGHGKVKRMWSYGKPEHWEGEIKYGKERIAKIMTTKSKRGLKFEQNQLARAKANLPISKRYCDERERITQQFEWSKVSQRHTEARDAFKDHIAAIMALEPLTMEGVIIQAQAVAAWACMEPIHRYFEAQAPEWSFKLATSIMKHSTGAV